MYYQELIQKLWDFNKKTKLGSTAIAMYLYLLKLGNDTESYTISVSDVTISNVLSITKKTVKPTKEKLRKSGLIQYENKIGFPCSYRLSVNYPLEIPESKKNQNSSQISNSKENEIQVPITENLEPFDSPAKIFPKIREQNDEILDSDTLNRMIKTSEIPTLEEFMTYAKTLDNYETILDSNIKEKYDSWTKNNWKNNSGRPITNWKSSLKSALPYMKNDTNNEISPLDFIPNIKRPISK